MNYFPLLKSGNKFPNSESVDSYTGTVLTLFILTIKRANPLANLNILIVMNLKTHKILKAVLSLEYINTTQIISTINQLIKDQIIGNGECYLHVPKQYPFTTKGFLALLFDYNFHVSYYVKPDYLFDIKLIRSTIGHIEPENLPRLTEILDLYNDVFVPQYVKFLENGKLPEALNTLEIGSIDLTNSATSNPLRDKSSS